MQSQVEGHFHKLGPDEKKVLYSDEVFKEAALQWLIDTDQPLQAFEHPLFIRMMEIASRATRGVNIPNCKQMRASIMRLFNDQMCKLRECLQERSSSQCKALFKEIQLRDGSKSDTLQLLLDMKVCWGSTYVMLNRAERLRQVCSLCFGTYSTSLMSKHSMLTPFCTSFAVKN
ncbi:hypothetical protein C0991_006762 [Blastosporella zonata]|nr:hypothetical protein C0991_006762 [Blastosporella zonata]